MPWMKHSTFVSLSEGVFLKCTHHFIRLGGGCGTRSPYRLLMWRGAALHLARRPSHFCLKGSCDWSLEASSVHHVACHGREEAP